MRPSGVPSGQDVAVPLLVASTPIGNTDDASPRLRAALERADVIAAEDTRRLRRLAAALGVDVAGRVVSYHDHNEAARVESLLAELHDERVVLLVTDAGTPLVSDPGYRVVSAAVAAGIDVRALPGPSAVTAALAVSGLPVDRWCFEGFPPRRAAERRQLFVRLASEPRTLVFFEAPRRVAATLADLADAFGADRPAVVCRELTKTYEETIRGSLEELLTWAQGDVRGEITLVVAGATAVPQDVTDDVLRAAVRERIAGGMSRRDAATDVASTYQVARRRVYDLAHD